MPKAKLLILQQLNYHSKVPPDSQLLQIPLAALHGLTPPTLSPWATMVCPPDS